MNSNTPMVTVVIPTYNRAELLKISLQSVLNQDYPKLQVLVLDNASPDHTRTVVENFADLRISYIRHNYNIGLFGNWLQAIALNRSPYLTILQDDDVMLLGFIGESVKVLEQNPNGALSIAQVEGINANGDLVPLPEDTPPEGKVNGLDYLENMVAGKNWVIHASSVMMRSEALSKVGTFDTPHSKHSIDLNLYMRLAAQYDLVFIPQVLSQIRLHEGQDTQLRFRKMQGTGPLATIAERMDAAAYLLQSSRSSEITYRQWLSRRLLYMSYHRSTLTTEFIPNLNLSWQEKLQIALQEIGEIIPKNTPFILVDEDQWRFEFSKFFQIFPFLEQNGEYWGVPPNNETVIRELERMRQSGASFLVFGSPAFWWYDYYSEFRDYLNSNFSCVHNNSRLIIFDLKSVSL